MRARDARLAGALGSEVGVAWRSGLVVVVDVEASRAVDADALWARRRGSGGRKALLEVKLVLGRRRGEVLGLDGVAEEAVFRVLAVVGQGLVVGILLCGADGADEAH